MIENILLAKEQGVSENLHKRVGIINHPNVFIVEPNQKTGAVKLQLKKHAVSNLSKTEMEHLKGGEAAVTTSIGKCTGVFCCEDTSWISILTTVLITTSVFEAEP
jgi:hypothetical protein